MVEELEYLRSLFVTYFHISVLHCIIKVLHCFYVKYLFSISLTSREIKVYEIKISLKGQKQLSRIVTQFVALNIRYSKLF